MYIDYSVLLKLWEDIFNGFFNKNTFPFEQVHINYFTHVGSKELFMMRENVTFVWLHCFFVSGGLGYESQSGY
jgi:hypothetical protein